MKVENFAAQRAVNAKEYLVTDQGIDASRISVATGTTDGQTAQDYLVPAGADFSQRHPGHHAGGRVDGEAADPQAAGERHHTTTSPARRRSSKQARLSSTKLDSPGLSARREARRRTSSILRKFGADRMPVSLFVFGRKRSATAGSASGNWGGRMNDKLRQIQALLRSPDNAGSGHRRWGRQAAQHAAVLHLPARICGSTGSLRAPACTAATAPATRAPP